MNDLEFFKRLKALREKSMYIYGDLWNHVCISQGLTLRQAQDLYLTFRQLMNGVISEQTDFNKFQLVMEILEDAHELSNATWCKNIEIKGFPYNSKHIAVYWKEGNPDGNKKSNPIQYKEFALSDIKMYCFISDLVKNGYTILAIIQQCDTLFSSAKGYDGERPDGKADGELYVFEGDVFCTYNEVYGIYCTTHSAENGLYVATEQGYRRLLYTPGKGYLRKGKPDLDDELFLEYADNKFTKYILTLGHQFRKVGNIYVDTEFLK